MARRPLSDSRRGVLDRRVAPAMVLALAVLLGLAQDAVAARHQAVATIFPVGSIARAIGGDAFDVAVLLPPGASAHTYEPKPSQVAQVAAAEVVIVVGAGLDGWIDPLLKASERKAVEVRITRDIPLLGEGADEAIDQAGGDPHVWLDPKLMRERVVPRITEALKRAAPEADEAITLRAAAYLMQLDALNREITMRLASVKQRRFVAFHSAWRYFARRYNLEQVAVVEPSPGREPSARSIADLVRVAKEKDVKVVLIEPQFSPRAAQVIADEIGAKLVLVDPEGGDQSPGGASYIELMRTNAYALVKALQ